MTYWIDEIENPVVHFFWNNDPLEERVDWDTEERSDEDNLVILRTLKGFDYFKITNQVLKEFIELKYSSL